MSKSPSTSSELVTHHMSVRQRTINSVIGIVPAAIAIPLVLRSWAPLWFVISWVVTYLAVSALFITLVNFRYSSRVEGAWSASISGIFSIIPISVVLWAGDATDFYAAATIGVIFIAFEMSALPFLEVDFWRLGVLMVGGSLTLSGLLTINPIVAIALAPVTFAIVRSATRLRTLKDELEELLAAAELTIQHDTLTGLLNRRGLGDEIARMDGQDVTLALVDVDRFKMINDTHGHQVGDQVLVSLASDLRSRFGPEFQLGRLGGDEFVAVAPGKVSVESHLASPSRMTIALHQQTFTIECGLSIGVSHGHNTEGAGRLLSEAGFAMREAKLAGGSVSYFGEDLADRLDRTLEVAAMAAGSGDMGAFVPVAQTIRSEDRIIGCELLIRWQRPDGELLLPAQFLRLATEAGLLTTINDLMLDHAVRFAARFNNRPNAPFVSVNISAPHLGEAGFVDSIVELLDQYRVPPERLMIEITETEQIAGYDRWESAAAELRAHGVSLAIDDFGTGYSSIERLQYLPISHLKFDRSLVRSVSGPFGEIAIGVARFAEAVNIGIIAEGIETLDELDSMRAFGVSQFQGYFFHRPEPLDAVERLIIEDGLRLAVALPNASAHQID